MKNIKRIVSCAVIIILCYLLESTVLQKIALASIVPNLLIVVTSAFGFMRGKKEGMLIGFFCGLLKDVMTGQLLGIYALIFMVIGYGNGFFSKIFYGDDVKLPIFLIAASDFLYGIIIYAVMFMLRSDFNFGYYFQHIIMSELVYTVLISFGLYYLLLKVNLMLEEDEKRSASKFV